MKRCMGCMKTYGDNNDKCPHCGYMEDTDESDNPYMKPGSILSKRYIVGKYIRYDGFAVTYIGWDALLEKKVSVREYLPSRLSGHVTGQDEVKVCTGNDRKRYEAGMELLMAEAGYMMKLQSVPQIVRFYNFFKENGTAYFIEEYTEGATLSEMLEREGRIPADMALNIIMSVIGILEEVHKEGIIHYHISFGTILLTKDWKVKLSDLGMAKYEINNYAENNDINQNICTDEYDIAAVFYHMVTGMIPEYAIKGKLEPPSKLGADIPGNIETAIMNVLKSNIKECTGNCSRLKEEILAANEKKCCIIKLKENRPLWRKAVSGTACLIIIMVMMIWIGAVRFGFADSVRTMFDENYVEVPEVVSRTKDEAEKRLKNAGLIVQYVDYIEDDSIPMDCIYSQMPGANERVKKGGTVFLVVSCGTEKKKMINTVGYDASQMEEKLNKAGIAVHKIYESGYGAPGTVVRQMFGENEIEEGTELKEGMVVTLVISNGIENMDMSVKTKIPDFKGKTYKEALKLAEEYDIYIRVDKDKLSRHKLKGQIVKQNLSAETQVTAGTVVDITRSKGNMVIVPNFVLKDLGEAESLAKSSNITYEVVYENSDTVAKNHVISQSVEKGKEIQFTETVTLNVSKGNDKADTFRKTAEDKKQVTEKFSDNTVKVQETWHSDAETIASGEDKQKNSTDSITGKWTSDDSYINDSNYTYEKKTQYLVRTRSMEKETESSASPEMEGWELSYKLGNYNEYGEWSEWSETEAFSTDTRQTETKQEDREVISGYKYYNYSRWNEEEGRQEYTYADISGGTYEEKITDEPLELSQNYGGHMGTLPQDDGTIWWPVGDGNIYEYKTITLYRYRDRDVTYIYYFTRDVYGAWGKSKWVDEEPETSDTCEVIDIRVVYKYTKK